LERDGHDTALAKDLLEIFEATLANHVRLRERLVEELGRAGTRARRADLVSLNGKSMIVARANDSSITGSDASLAGS
jgi:hypothetical protein